MATFSTINVRHGYVVNSTETGTPGSFEGIGTFSEDGNPNNKIIFIKYTNASGQAVKSDYIKVSNIKDIRVASYRPQVFRVDTIAPIADYIEAGQDYIIRILIRQWGSGSQEDQHFKHIGAVRARYFANDANKDLMIEDLVDNMVALGNKNLSTSKDNLLTLVKNGTGASSTITITELIQPWSLGKREGRPLDYVIQLVPVTVNGDSVSEWATITNDTPSSRGVGTERLAKDMEYFLLKERGDIYGNMCWPYTFDTQYLANGIYDVIEIGYYFDDYHVFNQRSEKQITILAHKTGESDSTITDFITDALASNTGLTISSK